MIFKSLAVISIYLIPYGLLLNGSFINTWLFYLCWFIMGVGMAGIGLNIMHDAIHGAYSRSTFVNRLLGVSMNIIGGNAYVWHMQHNVLHHTYPNIHDADDDIDIPFLLRMSPNQPKHWFHRYQQVYIWLLYAFATLFWITTKDFVQLEKYRQRRLTKNTSEYLTRLFNIVIWKVIYYCYALVIPLLIIDMPTYHILLGFVLMHIVGGVLLSVIFQPAHVFPDSEYIQQETPEIDKSWMGYQLQTTTNFQLTGFMKWLAGGLNYQIEHHLFPSVCHIHYPKISGIVKETAEKYGLPYYFEKSHYSALKGHYKMVQGLGSA